MSSSKIGRDFPYYAGTPRRLSGEGWAVVLAGCLAGYVALMLIPDLMGRPAGLWVGAILFVALPLAALRVAAGSDFGAFLPKPSLRDIAIGAAHRIENPGQDPLVFIEVQRGDYLGEDDIVRLQDDFGREGQS